MSDRDDEPLKREITAGVREVPDQQRACERGVEERESLALVSRFKGSTTLAELAVRIERVHIVGLRASRFGDQWVARATAVDSRSVAVTHNDLDKAIEGAIERLEQAIAERRG